MGTNYYVVPNRPSIEEPIHIGKSSMGWMFLFHDVDEPYREVPVVWHSYDEVKDWLQRYTVDTDEYVILNEYDKVISLEEFINRIQEKQISCKNNPDNFKYCRNVGGYRFEEGEFC